MNHLASALCVVSTLALVACGHDDATCPTAAPTIDSFEVTPATAAPEDELMATVVVSNFELSGESSHGHSGTQSIGPDQPGLGPLDGDEHAAACAGGHAHIYLDSLMENPVAIAVTSSFALTVPAETSEGEHVLMARLHNRDHTIYEPQVIVEIPLTVTAP